MGLGKRPWAACELISVTLTAHNPLCMQVHLLKQEKVGCLSDNAAHLALEASNPSAVQTKPHGHGDVHALLHSSGLAKQWHEQGLKWVAFFQVR